ncbi:MAG: hypothetical protein AVDCRST_MAG14-1999 [uncultured Rubrobacteraceae bacterium]|uniref:Uncharacterized protein n=1 Tax=uncultured Rubrobacteraceae bacterium TaxID=349277 RepID=A0A6J4R1A0_9ACTN|nr:MAG: hypothetical protein AVDCRST_MAG14-1999 [uncultured Rubrobacteraceae bacterium]
MVMEEENVYVTLESEPQMLLIEKTWLWCSENEGESTNSRSSDGARREALR